LKSLRNSNCSGNDELSEKSLRTSRLCAFARNWAA
jgi:hypothetical protein